ncbi:MAG: NAD(P)H-hydrate dehydratase [Acidobacteriota bacterium]
MKILNVRQMVEVDRLTSEKYGMPGLLLMENAGIQLYLALKQHFEDALEGKRTAVICGKGNNGGDGIVLARQLAQRGLHPDLYLLSRVADVSGDAAINLRIFVASGWRVEEVTSIQRWEEIKPRLRLYDILVDALLGTGLTKPLRGLYSEVVSTINRSRAFVLAVDIPSGMFSDSLVVGVPTVHADLTVTFTAPKIAHILNPDQEAIGKLKIAPIGSPARLMENPDYDLNLITEEEARAALLPRPIASHKGHYGHVAMVAGSRGKAGAAALSSLAALGTGSGLVTAYLPQPVQAVVASFQPEIMTEGLASTDEGTFSLKCLDPLLGGLKGKDAAGLGPGLTTHAQTVSLVHQLVEQVEIPLVLDADALNAFGAEKEVPRSHAQPLILTPHPGEFSRLIGRPTGELLADRVNLARRFSRRHRVWLVLKGFRTLIAEPEGQVYVCPLGNPGMATAGMGDVLTGVITSVVGLYRARGMTRPAHITQAVSLGVYLHSLAGELAAAETGQEALTAGEVIAHLGMAFQRLRTSAT